MGWHMGSMGWHRVDGGAQGGTPKPRPCTRAGAAAAGGVGRAQQLQDPHGTAALTPVPTQRRAARGGGCTASASRARAAPTAAHTSPVASPASPGGARRAATAPPAPCCTTGSACRSVPTPPPRTRGSRAPSPPLPAPGCVPCAACAPMGASWCGFLRLPLLLGWSWSGCAGLWVPPGAMGARWGCGHDADALCRSVPAC